MTTDELREQPGVQGLVQLAHNAIDRINELENEVAVLKNALFQAQEAAKQLANQKQISSSPMPAQQQAPEYKGWYCAHCQRGVDGSEVTYHEQHTVCGRVITDDVPPKAQQQEPVAWRNAALRVGEDLCSVGPFGYYDMTAEQWLDWALSVVTVHAPPASKPWVGLTVCERTECFNSAEWNDLTQYAEVIEAKLREKNT